MIKTNLSLKLRKGAKLYKTNKARKHLDIIKDNKKIYSSSKHAWSRDINGREVSHYIDELDGWVHDSDRLKGYSISRYKFGNTELNFQGKVEEVKDSIDILNKRLAWKKQHDGCLCVECS